MSVFETTLYKKLESLFDYNFEPTMGSMVRSEEMVLCQLFLQPEASYFTISEMGEMGIAEFRDLNPSVNAFQRKYAAEVKRCDEMERQLRYIQSELIREQIFIPEADEKPRAPLPREILNLETHLERTENEIMELTGNGVNLKSDYLELCQMKRVLEGSQQFFDDYRQRRKSVVSILYDTEEMDISQSNLGFVAGIVETKRVPSFERMLWRISRGNVFFKQSPVEEPFIEPSTGHSIFKTVFVAFFQGEQLRNRVIKVCTGFRASIYSIPERNTDRNEMNKNLGVRLKDLEIVLNQTNDHRTSVLNVVAKNIQNWMIQVYKMKAIYHILNTFNDDVTKKCLIGECWCAKKNLQLIQRALVLGSTATGSPLSSFIHVVDTKEVPPTSNPTNKFTEIFQNLIDSYGIASYQEANPALYSIITFPFIFAVMFGDAGHGLILILAALAMILNEKKLNKTKSEILSLFFGGRYIILLMGIFSVYTGLIYNDVFSKSVNLFGSQWQNYYTWDEYKNVKNKVLIPEKGYKNSPYLFGMDPVWQLSSDKILVQNSHKMKTSIILGLFQMLFGVAVGIVNFTHFKEYSFILVEFLPHLLFLLCLIGYLTFLIFFKWIMYAADPTFGQYNEACAPSILIIFINMFLFNKTPYSEGCRPDMFENQYLIQKILIITAVVCIPVMFVGKPLVIMMERNKTHKKLTTSNSNGLELASNSVLEHEVAENEEETMSNVWINQSIHTIEFCLNTISHTASYLRLWALSLAHSQLSDVLWTMALREGLTPSGNMIIDSIKLYVWFAIWTFFTITILILMEGLSAFLHTLRLHWVEFMSKFYEGTGKKFEPFCFKILLEAAEIS